MRLTTVASIYVYKSPEKLSEKNIYDSSRAERGRRRKKLQKKKFNSLISSTSSSGKKFFMFGKAQQLNSILIGCILV
jgi:hypothetical protein